MPFIWTCLRIHAKSLQAAQDSLAEELDDTSQELDHVRQHEAELNSALGDAKEQLATVQAMLQDTHRSWLSPDSANKLRLEAQEWQEKHNQIEHRHESLLEDFQHLSDRKRAVETERRRQHEYRHRIAALCAGLQQVQRGIADLQGLCCNVRFFQELECCVLCTPGAHGTIACILAGL